MILSGQSFDAAGADFSALTGLKSLCKTFSFGQVEGADRLLPGINLIVAEDQEVASCLAADEVWKVLSATGPRVLGTATGGTMEPIWANIHRWLRDGLDLRELKTAGLDEYVGLNPEAHQSYRSEMLRHLTPLTKYGFDPESGLHLPKTWNHEEVLPKNEKELLIECKRYEDFVSQNPPKLQLLGLGHDGHVGFSMPWSKSSALDVGTHLTTLSDETRRANARFFGGDTNAVPQQAVTMGLGSLKGMAEKGTELLLVATGAGKQDALYETLCGPIWSGCPASYLRLLPNVTMIVDKEAAGRLIG